MRQDYNICKITSNKCANCVLEGVVAHPATAASRDRTPCKKPKKNLPHPSARFGALLYTCYLQKSSGPITSASRRSFSAFHEDRSICVGISYWLLVVLVWGVQSESDLLNHVHVIISIHSSSQSLGSNENELPTD